MLRKANSLNMIDVLPPIASSASGAPASTPAASRLQPLAAPARHEPAPAAGKAGGASAVAEVPAAASGAATAASSAFYSSATKPAGAAAAPATDSSGTISGSSSNNVTLAVSSQLPRSMQRAAWSLRDFRVLRHLYKGYAANIYRVSGRSMWQVYVYVYERQGVRRVPSPARP